MNTIKYRFKQIQKLGKLFDESHLTNRYISGNTKDGTYIKLSKTNYNEEVGVYTSYYREGKILYIQTNIFREGKLVCVFKDYPCMQFSKIKMHNKRLFNKYRNNILGRNGTLVSNTVYYIN